jgi:hypothetical protein
MLSAFCIKNKLAKFLHHVKTAGHLIVLLASNLSIAIALYPRST